MGEPDTGIDWMGTGDVTFETSLYDEKGNRRENLLFSDLFGVSYAGRRVDTRSDCYQLIRSRNPVLAGTEETELLINGGETLLCTLNQGCNAEVLCTYVPKIPNQPREKAWLCDLETDYPTVVYNTYGKGRIIYFANQTDKLYYTSGHDDFRTLFQQAIKHLCNGEFTVNTNAPSSVHIYLMQDRLDSRNYICSYVNATSSPVRPLRELTPVHNLTCELMLPYGNLTESRIVYSESDVTLEQCNKFKDRARVMIRIPLLVEFTSVSLTVA